MGNADGLKHDKRRQQAAEVTKEDHENAEMEQVRAPHQLAPAEQLTGAGLPGVLFAIEAQDARQCEHGKAEVGIPTKQQVIDVAHGSLSGPMVLAVGDDW